MAELHQRMITGQGGWWGAASTAAFSAVEPLYRAVIRRRNAGFDQSGPTFRLPAPVVSVGNITVGGVGKTPMCIRLAQWANGLGKKPAILARGYRPGPDGRNDEQRMIELLCPFAVCLSGAQRYDAGQEAIRRHAADLIILDDGFQHRRLARDLDLCLIDATCPFGYGRLLPRGLLREPLEGLARAHAIIITRCDLTSESELASIEKVLDRFAPAALRVRSTHKTVGLSMIDGAPWTAPAPLVVFAVAAIARPSAFAESLRREGMNPAGSRWFPDHHLYTKHDVEAILRASDRCGAIPIAITEKDRSKLEVLVTTAERHRFVVVRVAMDFPYGGWSDLEARLTAVLSGKNREPQVFAS